MLAALVLGISCADLADLLGLFASLTAIIFALAASIAACVTSCRMLVHLPFLRLPYMSLPYFVHVSLPCFLVCLILEFMFFLLFCLPYVSLSALYFDTMKCFSI